VTFTSYHHCFSQNAVLEAVPTLLMVSDRNLRTLELLCLVLYTDMEHSLFLEQICTLLFFDMDLVVLLLQLLYCKTVD
jgi:hypothetical protein